MSDHTKLHNVHARLSAMRIKPGVDYAVIMKYGEAHLLVRSAWKDDVMREAELCGFAFKTVHEIASHE